MKHHLCLLGLAVAGAPAHGFSTTAVLRSPATPAGRWRSPVIRIAAPPTGSDGLRPMPRVHCYRNDGLTETLWRTTSLQQRRPTRLLSGASSADEAASSPSSSSSSSSDGASTALDRVLSQLTNAFPMFVLGSAVLAVLRPDTLLWVNRGGLIAAMLAAVMCGTGLTLTTGDFRAVFDRSNVVSVPLGVACQFGIMPLAAALVGRTMFLSGSAAAVGATTSAQAATAGPALFLGLCLVGCSPGGTASNLVSLIAGADVALSVVLTACSTLLAVAATPALVRLLAGSAVAVSGAPLVVATARVVLAPVLLGMLLNRRAPRLSRALARWTPVLSVLLVSLICGGVVAETVPLLARGGGGTGAVTTQRVALAVALVHTLGFAAGYVVPRFLFGRSETTSRTISIEVGMQNSALAVVLARSLGAPPLASLPGALSATAHSCLGSLLAAYWRLRKVKDDKDAGGMSGSK